MEAGWCHSKAELSDLHEYFILHGVRKSNSISAVSELELRQIIAEATQNPSIADLFGDNLSDIDDEAEAVRYSIHSR